MENRRESSYLPASDNDNTCDVYRDSLEMYSDECDTLECIYDVGGRDTESINKDEDIKEETEVSDKNIENEQTLFYHNNVHFISQV